MELRTWDGRHRWTVPWLLPVVQAAVNAGCAEEGIPRPLGPTPFQVSTVKRAVSNRENLGPAAG